jgi:hypothetical protein
MAPVFAHVTEKILTQDKFLSLHGNHSRNGQMGGTKAWITGKHEECLDNRKQRAAFALNRYFPFSESSGSKS